MAKSGPQIKNRRQCIFCPNDADSDEHPLPQWLDSVLGPRLDRHFHFNTRTIGPDDFPHVKKKSGAPRTKRLRVVCKSCNNGWMSTLQERAKPLVSNLILDKEIMLSPRDKQLLAAWMAMTTMVLEFDNAERAISERERLWLHSLCVPPPSHWVIFAGRVSGDLDSNWYSYNQATIGSGNEPLPTMSNIQKSYLVIGHIVLITCSATTPHLINGANYDEARPNFGDRHGLTRIWPPSETELNWQSLTAHALIDLQLLAYAKNPEKLAAKYHGMMAIQMRPRRGKSSATETSALEEE